MSLFYKYGKNIARHFRSTTRSISTEQTSPRILITGSLGQLGSGLAVILREKYGKENIITSDIRKPSSEIASRGPSIFLDVIDFQNLERIVVNHRIDWIIHFSGILSAVAEANVPQSMRVNIGGMHNMMEVAKQHGLRLFIPSTIGAFGPESPRNPTPNLCIQRPKTIYGVAKVHAELLGEYYHAKYGLDFRCLRFPGVISSDSVPGGGTTDYAVHIFHQALKEGKYTCYLKPTTRLPMMHIDDCHRSVVEFMTKASDTLPGRTYNVTGVSFTPEELEQEIRKFIPNFEIIYLPDHRQDIADSWPQVLDDSCAKNDWGWEAKYGLKEIVETMLRDLTPFYKTTSNIK
ncbi:L-threonine 3-dehydrogenase, mitochondrial isoform X2 [Folsomia candida]|uniref:L-threonine 3-dehydrogenase, mitochondrial isoform X2 n=1 Tax=Folsomia candida TaxID=158441 RepID=UPI000B8F33F1|nr:L-threonine 3-dehydrogenase, mitochondrial isoform X2 [Folsomia candida]